MTANTQRPSINAALVKTLRENRCRRDRLQEGAGGDARRSRGRGRSAARRRDRERGERRSIGWRRRARRPGRRGDDGAIVELNTETDFVARTEAFRNAAAAFAGIALGVQGDRSRLLDAPAPDGDGCVSDAIARLTARTGERVNLRRSAFVSVELGVIASYVHNAAAPGLGSIGVLVALESAGRADALHAIGRGSPCTSPPALRCGCRARTSRRKCWRQKRAELIAQARQDRASRQRSSEDGRGPDAQVLRGSRCSACSRSCSNPDQRVDQALKDAEHAAGVAIASQGLRPLPDRRGHREGRTVRTRRAGLCCGIEQERRETGYRARSGGRGIFEAHAQASAWISGRLRSRGRRPRRRRRLAAVSRSDPKRCLQRATARAAHGRPPVQNGLAETGRPGLRRSRRRRRAADSVPPCRQRRDCRSAQRAYGAPLWRFAYPTAYRDDFGFDEGPRAVPVVVNGKIYTFGPRDNCTPSTSRPARSGTSTRCGGSACGRDSSARPARRWSKTAG